MPNYVTLDRSWRLLMLDLGLDLDEIARRADLSAQLVRQDSFRVSLAQYFNIAEAVEAMSGDPLLPLRAGKALNPGAFSPVFFAAMCSSTLAVALERISLHKRLMAPMQLLVRRTNEGVEVSWAWDDPTLTPPRLLIATELVMMTQIARFGLREQVNPVRVLTPVTLAPTQAYAEFFGVSPTKSDVPKLVFSAADAERPLATASEEMWSIFEPDLRRRTQLLEDHRQVADRVRSVLLECLPSGEATLHGTARRLGMSERSLQRRLATEQASFRDLVQEAREKLALHYLSRTSLPYEEISFLLGFDETSSFFRAFRMWTGSTPEATRSRSAVL